MANIFYAERIFLTRLDFLNRTTAFSTTPKIGFPPPWRHKW